MRPRVGYVFMRNCSAPHLGMLEGGARLFCGHCMNELLEQRAGLLLNVSSSMCCTVVIEGPGCVECSSAGMLSGDHAAADALPCMLEGPLNSLSRLRVARRRRTSSA